MAFLSRWILRLFFALAFVAFLTFAFANRHFVTVSFDPFAGGDIPAFAIHAPLFAVLILAAMVGVVFGGAATWLAQGRRRKAARLARSEAERLRAEVQALKAQLSQPSSAVAPQRGRA